MVKGFDVCPVCLNVKPHEDKKGHAYIVRYCRRRKKHKELGADEVITMETHYLHK